MDDEKKVEELAKPKGIPWEPKGIPWEKFQPHWDPKAFAKAMRAKGLTTHEAVTHNQCLVLETIRAYWELSLAKANEFARIEEVK